jgi:hypothetical protein
MRECDKLPRSPGHEIWNGIHIAVNSFYLKCLVIQDRVIPAPESDDFIFNRFKGA